MKKIFTLFLLCSFIINCGIAIANFLNTNRQNLLKLSIGMTKEEVMRIMRTNTLSAGTIKASNPYRSEILRSKEKTFEVWYYWTDEKKVDQAITDDELTPLVFDGDKLIGWGRSFFQDFVIRYEIIIR